MGGETTKGIRAAAGAAGGKPPIEYATLALRCPLCNTEFTSEIPLVSEPEGRDSDLRPRYPVVDPLPTLIHSCPHCQFTAYQDGYGVKPFDVDEDEDEFSLQPGDRLVQRFPMPEDDDLEDLRRLIRHGDLVRGIAEGREPYGAERYVLGARIYEFLTEDDAYGVADYYLRGSWCARVLQTPELERLCQREAIQHFQHALDHSQVSESDRPRTTYLLAELSRRSGDFAKAVDLFSQLDSNQDPEEEESVLFANLSRKQLSLAVVKSEINATISEDDLVEEHEEE
ncbi:MAG TPA: DUF2225 domain-containing protein [Myxococcales bacterium]|jgi:uncharacterized protein (DUF2225 family)